MSEDLFYQVLVTAGIVSYDLSSDLSSFVLEEHHRLPTTLTVHLADPFKVFSHALREGMEVQVDLGTEQDHSVLFQGRIYRLEAKFPDSGTPTLDVHALDNTMRMGLQLRSRGFTDQSLSGIIQAVASEYFSSINVSLSGDPSFVRNGLRQHEETDLAFLLRLAEQYGCELFVEAGTTGEVLHFVSQAELMSGEPVDTLYHGRARVPQAMLRFEGSADIADVRLPRALSGIDPNTGEVIDVVQGQNEEVGNIEDVRFSENLDAFRAAHPTRALSLELLIEQGDAVVEELRTELGEAVREAVPTFTTATEIDALASNQFSISLHGMRGKGATHGNKNLRANSVVDLDDLGGRFSGHWYLTRVWHRVDTQGYRTEFECRR